VPHGCWNTSKALTRQDVLFESGLKPSSDETTAKALKCVGADLPDWKREESSELVPTTEKDAVSLQAPDAAWHKREGFT